MGYLLGVGTGLLCIVKFDLAIHACTISFSVKYAIEALVFAVVLLSKGRAWVGPNSRLRGGQSKHSVQKLLSRLKTPFVCIRHVERGELVPELLGTNFVRVRLDSAEPKRIAEHPGRFQ